MDLSPFLACPRFFLCSSSGFDAAFLQTGDLSPTMVGWHPNRTRKRKYEAGWRPNN